MENRFRKLRVASLICGLASWVLCLIAALLMDLFPLWLADVLTVCWVAASLGAVVLSITVRFFVGIRKDLLLRWGMLCGSVMIFAQVLFFGLMYFQQHFEWETSSVGLVSLGLALGVTALFVCLYLFAARRGQAKIENTPVPEVGREERRYE